MASEERQPTPVEAKPPAAKPPEPPPPELTPLELLRARLVRTPPRTDFYTAVTLIERLSPENGRIGGSSALRDEAIWFRHSVSFGFQPNDISAIRWVTVPDPEGLADRGRFEVTTCVLGLSGADSPLPLYHVEELLLETEEAELQAAFLDLFHNRLTALFYRARSKYSPSREYLRGGADPLSARILAAAGFDPGTEATPREIRRSELLGLAALMATGGGTARSIENSLRALLATELDGSPIALHQMTGGWIEFDEEQRTKLGKNNSSLAVSWILGTRVRHPAHQARVSVGPMAPDKARAFTPGGASFERTQKLMESLCRDPIAVEIEVLIDQNAYPPFFLRAKGGRVLGENVFLSSRRRTGGVLRRVYDLDEAAAAKKAGKAPPRPAGGNAGRQPSKPAPAKAGAPTSGKPAPGKPAPGKPTPGKR
jgi:type VI secretion system protein ImpH